MNKPTYKDSDLTPLPGDIIRHHKRNVWWEVLGPYDPDNHRLEHLIKVSGHLLRPTTRGLNVQDCLLVYRKPCEGVEAYLAGETGVVLKYMGATASVESHRERSEGSPLPRYYFSLKCPEICLQELVADTIHELEEEFIIAVENWLETQTPEPHSH